MSDQGRTVFIFTGHVASTDWGIIELECVGETRGHYQCRVHQTIGPSTKVETVITGFRRDIVFATRGEALAAARDNIRSRVAEAHTAVEKWVGLGKALDADIVREAA